MGFSLYRFAALTVDGSERVHMLEVNKDPRHHFGNQAVIIDPDGKMVGTYAMNKDRASSVASPFAITLCGAGTCIVGWDLTSFDVTGHFVGQNDPRYEDPYDTFAPMAFVGSADGPVFQVGIGAKEHRGLRVRVVKVP